jgi:hypothetical protein
MYTVRKETSMYPYGIPDYREYASSTEESVFFGSLFDFSFSQFVTEHLIRVLYILAFIVAVIAAISSVVALFSQGVMAGLFSILLAPLAFLLVMVIARVWLEMLVVLFRIASYLREINEKVK